MQTFVIAEAGISHCGSLTRAYEAINVAKEAGANACKFQYFDAKKLAVARGKPELVDALLQYQMPDEWLAALCTRCDEVGIEFMATTYYEEGLHKVAPFVEKFKIGHAEASNRPFIEAHYQYDKPTFISNDASVDPKFRHDAGDLTQYLWCSSKYPTPISEADLKPLGWQGDFDGYSDHTRNVLTGALAVAAGATIVEVHFEPWGASHPDNCVSLSPYELWQYIENIRLAEKAVYGVWASTPRSP